MNVFIWGTGKMTESVLKTIGKDIPHVHVIGIIDDSQDASCREYNQLPIYQPNIVMEKSFDYIIILSDSFYIIKEELRTRYHVDDSKLQGKYFLLKQKMLCKYKTSNDPEIQNILTYWKKHNISVFNQYVQWKKEFSEVYWDHDADLPYIFFEGKKMYFPYDMKFKYHEGKKVVYDLLGEQQDTSPHLYVEGNHMVHKGDVVVDAGVCEGNFILRYIDDISKAYLFESDVRWIKPLKKTFEKFKDKVVIIDKYLGNINDENSVTLDSVVKEKIDFLKMDIEGAEVDALKGAKNVLTKSNAKCSICSYHRYGDENKIRSILKKYGYRTSVSKGYMVFLYDPDIYGTADFRHGIVRAEKVIN